MRKHRWAALLALVLCSGGWLGPAGATAHPMGNFSINHYAAITVAGDRVQVFFLLDMAEIPTFQELTALAAAQGIGDLATDPARRLPAAARTAYLAARARDLAGNLHLRVDGRPVPLRLEAADLTFPPGAGKLPTERIYLALDARLPGGGEHNVQYEDTNFPDRAGWKEIIGRATAGARLSQASVPGQDRSRALTIYPTNATSSPPHDLSATFGALAGPPLPAYRGTIWGAEAIDAAQAGSATIGATGRGTQRTTSWIQQRTDALTNLIARKDSTADVLLFSLLVAFGLGAVHAFSPGHGKTMVAAYLVGSRGTTRQAMLLGATVTITHTAGVFVLGLITLFASAYLVPDKLYPWLGFVSGLLVAAMGVGLFAQRLGNLRRHPRHGGAHEPGADSTTRGGRA